MDAAVKRAAILLVLLALGACKGIGLSSMDTSGPATPEGLSALDTESAEDKADEKWFDGFYSGSHGWGWGGGKDSNCSFYGTCKSNSAAPE